MTTSGRGDWRGTVGVTTPKRCTRTLAAENVAVEGRECTDLVFADVVMPGELGSTPFIGRPMRIVAPRQLRLPWPGSPATGPSFHWPMRSTCRAEFSARPLPPDRLPR